MRFGDLDRDGTLDQAVANAGSNDVWCWWGEDGTFGPPVSYPVGRGPYAVTLGDLDGNRAADLAVANNFSGDVSVLLQDGPPSGDGASGVPSCDPLVEACVPAAAEEEAPPAAASAGPAGEGPAVGRNRMSDLRAVRLRAFCAENGSVRVRLRVRATKPRLVSRVWVRFTVSRQGAATGVTVRVRERTLLSVPAVFPAVAAGGPACGRSVVARLDPGDRLAERRERENTNSVRIRAHP